LNSTKFTARLCFTQAEKGGDSASKPLKKDELAASLWPLFGFAAKLCFHLTGTYSLYWLENGRNPAKICFTCGKVMLEVADFTPILGVVVHFVT
jgi:hypothetical protein